MASYLIPTLIAGRALLSPAAGDLLGRAAREPLKDRAMTRIGAVIRKELRQHLVSYRFRIGSALAVILAALTALVATANLGSRLAVHQTELEQERLALGRLHVYSFLQPLARRAPEPLSVFHHGLEGQLGEEVRIHVFEIPAEATGADHGNAYLSEPQNLDLTLIVQVVLGLLALLLTFDTVVGERETRNLELVLAHGIGHRSLLVGKFLGAFLALCLPLAASFGLSVTVLFSSTDVTFQSQHWLRLAGLGGAYAVYLAVMLLLGFLVSVYSRDTAEALVVAILSWLILVFLIPRLAFAVTQQVAGWDHGPTDFREAISHLEDERDQQLDTAWRKDPLRTQPSGHVAPVIETGRNRAVLRRYGSASYYDSLATYYREEVKIGLHYATRIYDLATTHEEDKQVLRQLERLMAVVSPSLLLDRIAESLAGTSLTDHDAFLTSCRVYRMDLLDTLAANHVFGSWRWFTDDPQGTRPWPNLLGLEPEDVDTKSFPMLAERFRSPEIQERLQDELAGRRRDLQSRLDITPLPTFRHGGPDPAQTARRVIPELLLLGTLGVLAAVVVLRGFVHDDLRAINTAAIDVLPGGAGR